MVLGKIVSELVLVLITRSLRLPPLKSESVFQDNYYLSAS